MLLQFKFSNYRCFAEETNFNMAAAPIKEHKKSLIPNNGVYVLPVSALYGANASGKSSFFMAFNSMRRAVVNRTFAEIKNIDNKSSVFTTPFLFTGNTKNADVLLSKPSMFEAIFSSDGYAYRYGFECTKNKFVSEWLYKQKISIYPTLEKRIYEIKDSSNDIDLGKINKQLKAEIEYCNSMKSDTSLLLSDVGKRGKNKELLNVFLLFARAQVLLTQDQEIMTSFGYEQFVGEAIYDDDDFLHLTKKTTKDELLNIIQEIDPCISDIKVNKELDENGEPEYSLKSIHKVGNNKYEIPFKAESDGTKKDLFISVLLLGSLITGSPLFIDELDAKFHPLLLRKIVKMYKNRELNEKGAQLIFSAHNIINMDSSDLRRDEVWFVEKKNQKSEMYSLYDFDDEDEKIRSDLDFGKHYLSGRFGAIPFQD